MSHDHASPGAAGRAGARFKRRLAVTAVLVGGYLVVQVVGGLLTNSLALLADAGHMATDLLGLTMALAAIHAADRGSRRSDRTFGMYRLEVLAALANAVLLTGLVVFVLYEAVGRIGDPPEVLAGGMLTVATGGLVVNLIGLALLHGGARESINIEGAYLEVLADTLGSIAAIIAAIVIATTGAAIADPITSLAVGLFVLPRAWRLGRESLRILLQSAPRDVDVDAVTEALAAIEGVDDVHDLHVWTLTSSMPVASVHLRVDRHGIADEVLADAQQLLRDRCGITHATVQVDPFDDDRCRELTW
ncbi:cation transporter [Nitriliruptoraceae bacterium ZYF776]|nr:cation transporter [Profundirhabdus halotolerans]